MEYSGLRDWIEKMNRAGQIREIRGAHWDLEVGALSAMVRDRKDAPSLLFDEIVGYPEGYRILVNPLDSLDRVAFTLGLPLGLRPMDFVKRLKDKIKALKPIEPRMVDDGPVLENVWEEKEIDITKFPTPKWSSKDGGRYIGTGSVVITQDPDDGWVNLGNYRVMIHDPVTLGYFIAPGRHGWIHRQKYFDAGKPCKIVVSVGHDPLISLAGSIDVPYGESEYAWVGGIRGEPVDLIQGAETGLPFPADAEIVIEGETTPDETRTEGPFAEYMGYYGGKERVEHTIKIKRVLFRNAPVILGMPLSTGLVDNRNFKSMLTPAMIWNEMENAGIPDIQGVWCIDAALSHLITVVSIKQRYPGHVTQAGLITTGCRSGGHLGRYVILVDEDIDPSNKEEVIWAVATRADPAEAIQIIRRCWSSPLDPIIHPDKKGLNSRAIIDACRPWEWKDAFPTVVEISPELRRKTTKKWSSLLEQWGGHHLTGD